MYTVCFSLVDKTINVQELAASGRFIVQKNPSGQIIKLSSTPENYVSFQQAGKDIQKKQFSRFIIEVDPGRRVVRKEITIVGRSNSPVRETRELGRTVYTGDGIISSSETRRAVGGDTKLVEEAVFSPSGEKSITREVDFGPTGRSVTQVRSGVEKTKFVTKVALRPIEKAGLDLSKATFTGLSSSGTPIFTDPTGKSIGTFQSPNKAAEAAARKALGSRDTFDKLDRIRAKFEKEDAQKLKEAIGRKPFSPDPRTSRAVSFDALGNATFETSRGEQFGFDIPTGATPSAAGFSRLGEVRDISSAEDRAAGLKTQTVSRTLVAAGPLVLAPKPIRIELEDVGGPGISQGLLSPAKPRTLRSKISSVTSTAVATVLGTGSQLKAGAANLAVLGFAGVAVVATGSGIPAKTLFDTAKLEKTLLQAERTNTERLREQTKILLSREQGQKRTITPTDRAFALSKGLNEAAKAIGIRGVRLVQTAATKPIATITTFYGFSRVGVLLAGKVGTKAALGVELGVIGTLGAIETAFTPKDRRLSVGVGNVGLVGGFGALRVGLPKARQFVDERFRQVELQFKPLFAGKSKQVGRGVSAKAIRIEDVTGSQGKGVPTGFEAKINQFLKTKTTVSKSPVIGEIQGGTSFVPFRGVRLFEKPLGIQKGGKVVKVGDVIRFGFDRGGVRTSIVKSPKFITVKQRSLETGKLLGQSQSRTLEPLDIKTVQLGDALTGKTPPFGIPGKSLEKSYSIEARSFFGVGEAGRLQISGGGLLGRFTGTKAQIIKAPFTKQIIQEFKILGGRGPPKVTRRFVGVAKTKPESIEFGDGSGSLLPKQLTFKKVGPKQVGKDLFGLESKVVKTPGVLRVKSETVVIPEQQFTITLKPKTALPLSKISAARQKVTSADKKIIAQLKQAGQKARLAAAKRVDAERGGLKQVFVKQITVARAKTSKVLEKFTKSIKRDVGDVGQSVAKVKFFSVAKSKPVSVAGVGLASGVGVKVSGAVATRAILGLKQRASQKIVSKAKVGLGQRQIISSNLKLRDNVLGVQRSRAGVKPAQAIRSIQGVSPAQRTLQGLVSASQARSVPGRTAPVRQFIQPDIIVPGVPPPRLPPLGGLPLPVFGFGLGRRDAFVRPTRRTQYRSDIFSLEGNIRVNKKELAVLERELTGLEARPLVKL